MSFRLGHWTGSGVPQKVLYRTIRTIITRYMQGPKLSAPLSSVGNRRDADPLREHGKFHFISLPSQLVLVGIQV